MFNLKKVTDLCSLSFLCCLIFGIFISIIFCLPSVSILFRDKVGTELSASLFDITVLVLPDNVLNMLISRILILSMQSYLL